MRRSSSLWLFLIIALFAMGATHLEAAVPVDAKPRFLPLWTQVKEGEAVQVHIDHEEPVALQQGDLIDSDDHEPLAAWGQGWFEGEVPDPTWRESFLISRENTKYKEGAVSLNQTTG